MTTRVVGLRRRVGLQAAAAALLLPGSLQTRPVLAQAPPSQVPPAQPLLPAPRALATELQQALQKKEPLVLMVSLDGCPFCKIARERYLAPMRRDDGLPVVQIDMLSRASLFGWDGKTTTHAELIERLGVRIAPTLVFYGPNGREVAERLVGLGSEDFYGAYLEQRLEQARRAMRG